MGPLFNREAWVMPQVLKEDIRLSIIDAALLVFAKHGYTKTTMAMIAEQAGLGTASIYRYYPAKETLFEAAIPEQVVTDFRDILTRRVEALGALKPNMPDQSAEEMMQFWIKHRLAVVILLDRARGTKYEHFGEQFVHSLVTLTKHQLAHHQPPIKLSKAQDFVLTRIFQNTRSMIADILEQYPSEVGLRSAVYAFWSYQIAGLEGFAEHAKNNLPSALPLAHNREKNA